MDPSITSELNATSNARLPKTMMGRKRNRLGLATIASALALSVSAVGAFQSAIPAGNRRKTPIIPADYNNNHIDAMRLNVVTDPDVMLMERVNNGLYDWPKKNGASEQGSKRKRPPRVTVKSRAAAAATATEVAEPENAKTKGRTTTSKINNTKVSSMPSRDRLQTKKSPYRSSTMPGYGSQASARTGREKAFRDGIKLVEERTGKKFVDTSEARKKRRQVNGEAMYKTSASVPDSLVQFANEIHKIDRITPKEEIELGEKTQEAIRLQTLHDDLTEQLSRPPTDEEWCAAAGKINLEAIKQAIDDGLDAKNQLVTANLRMVQGVVNLYIRNGLGGQYNAGDLMQEGIMVRTAFV